MIYKYLSPARLDVLRNGTLRATQADALNDPFELKPFFSSVFSVHELNQQFSDEIAITAAFEEAIADLPPELQRVLPREKILALAQDPAFRPAFNAMLEQEVETFFEHQMPSFTEMLRSRLHAVLGSSVGIVSFSRVADETLMWSHYAVDHKGFAVGFDENHPFFDRRRSSGDEFFHLRPVTYHPASVNYASLSELDGAAMLCAKQDRWSYEHESRMLIPLEKTDSLHANEAIHLVEYPREVVREVVFGHRASVDLIREVVSELESGRDFKDVSLRQARADWASGRIVVNALRLPL
jgi:hypothetical protein